MEYDVKGNITKKGDIGGQFYYNTPNKPYAVSGLDAGTNLSVPPRNQNVTYTSFERPLTITENGYVATFTYDGSGNRHKMQLTKNGSSELTRYYLGDCYETDVTTSGTKQRLYLNGDAYSAPAVYVNSGSGWQLYYICRDYQGSITHIVNSTGTLTQELSYDAWGRLRNPSTQETYLPDNEPTLFLGRGYTGHEHLTPFGLLNMNARLYDPAFGRFLAPDPYVQAPDFSQNFNRYSYCLNNPLIYTDKDGELVWFVPVIIGAVIGAYSGGVIANDGQYNLMKWDYSSSKTWGYMLGGAIVGGASGYVGWAMAGASFTNSVGTWAYTGGKTPISISLGVASYDFTNNEWGYLGKKGNEWYENIGYGLGALANVSDILAGFKPGNVTLRTENDPNYSSKGDPIGHSQITKGNDVIIDWGPAENKTSLFGLVEGTNSYEQGTLISNLKGSSFWNPVDIKGVNIDRILRFSNYLNKGGKYNLLYNNCVSMTSRALNMSGVFNIGIHPYLLQAQMYLRSIGVRPMFYSHFLINR